MADDLELIRGTLDLLILKALAWKPMHGFAVLHWIEETSRHKLQIEEGALYPALHRMEQAGWIAADWQITENNRRARYYSLTRAGRKRLGEEEEKWRRLTLGVDRVLGAL